jgi:very-short-patch-repair endonuclease
MTPIQTLGKNGRPLKYPRADWVNDPIEFGLPAFVTEFKFHPTRRWRFDYAWPQHKVALEVDGASGSYGRHSRPGGMRADHEKLNTATAMGWRVLRVLAGEEVRLTTLRLLLDTLNSKAAA